MYKAVLASMVMLVSAAQLSAQITTYVAPPRPLPPSPQAIASADSVRRDSVAQVSMRNMKEWVDSAAGVAVPAYDTTVVAFDDSTRAVVTTFSNGSAAPETASALPALLLLGLGSLVAGAALLANRPRA